MRRNTVAVIVVALAILLVAPGVMAQTSPADVVQSYYTALGESAAGGDTTVLLDLFADDATVEVGGFTPGPVQGKETIQSTLGGMFALLKGVSISLGDVTVDGNSVSTTYTMAVEGQEGEVAATDTFVIKDGLIKSLVITIDLGAMGPIPVPVALPVALPETGGAVSGLLPGLLALGGAALVGLSRRFAR